MTSLVSMPRRKLPLRLKRAEFAYTRYFELVPAGVPHEEVASTSFWAHVMPVLRVLDIVEAVAEDGAWEADLRLVRKSPGRLEWRVLRHFSGAPVEQDRPARFELKWGGPALKWTIRDRRDGKVVAEGFNKPGAEQEMARLEVEAAR